MKELKSLTTAQRLTLARKSEPFFIRYNRTQALQGAFNNVSSLLTAAEAKKYANEIWTLISATSQTIRYDSDTCQFSMRKENYVTANTITKKNIQVEKMKELIELLEDQQLLEWYKGFKHTLSNAKGIEKAMRSILVFSPAWLAMFDVRLCKSYGTAREFDLVILKDKHGKLVSTKGMRGIGQEKSFLKEMNSVVDAATITIDGELVTNLVYTSVFNNSSLKCSGRIFGGAFTTEKSHLRSTITINGEHVSEVDYKNNHIRILYNEYGIDYQEDCYAIPHNTLWDIKEQRSLVKKSMLACLNANSKKAAQGAIIQELTQNKEKYSTIKACKDSAVYIMEELVKMHKLISTNHFFQGEWGRLQHIDSRMAQQVVKYFTAIGEVCLPYHDSFVVVSRLEDTLVQVMKEAWEIVLGDSKGFGYDVEFSNKQPIQSTEVTGHLDTIVPLSMYQEYDYTVTNTAPVEDCTRRHPPVPMPSYQEEELASQTHCYSDYMDSIEELLEGEGLPF